MYNILAVFDFCSESGVLQTFQIVGYLITIIKIIVPLLLIIFGAIDFGKAAMASDDKAISKAAQMLVVRAAGGIIIFFIPTIINFAVSLISSWSEVETEFTNCSTCLFETGNCDNLIKEAKKSNCEAKTTSKEKCTYNENTDFCNCVDI